MRIAHIADVHLRGMSRHEECIDAFTRFADDVREKGVEHIFVGGDTFHTKTSGISPEYIDLMTWWLNTLSKDAHLHITLGNHDGNLVNLSRQDAISPIVAAINNSRVYLYKKSGVYQFAPGFNWCVFSLFDEPGWKDVKPIAGDVNIACYHGPVAGCKTESDWLIEDGLTVDFFESYDFAFLGDIHRTQFLGFRDVEVELTSEELSKHVTAKIVSAVGGKHKAIVKKGWIGYPGSTLQQNYAEHLQHGYFLWDIKDRQTFDVSFCEIENKRPYITVDWLGNVVTTVEQAKSDVKSLPGSRVRIYNPRPLPQKDVVDVSQRLRDVLQVSEVTFKHDQQIQRDVLFSTGTSELGKEDLRNPDVLLRLLKEYHHDTVISEETWSNVHELVKGYVAASCDEVVRNTKWILRHLKFDNTFAYGDSNIINFDNLSGIVGIFGPNRSGKSSIVGTMMYSLFNATDRGSIKNLFVVNVRKPHCYTRAVVAVNGVDYVIERQTVKNETKKGQVYASTALNVFRMEDGEAVDLAGEQRNDTEKVVRRLIGAPDDFLLTSLSAQDEIKMFIAQGSTRRKQILSRFLDLDIFDKMYDLAKNDLNSAKSATRMLPERDWMRLDTEAYERIEQCSSEIESKIRDVRQSSDRIFDIKERLKLHKDHTPVTRTQVNDQQHKVSLLEQKVKRLEEEVFFAKDSSSLLKRRLEDVSNILSEHDVADIRVKLSSLQQLESTVKQLRLSHESEKSKLKLQERSLKILDEVPCGDSFPTCKFIKDAHALKETVTFQRTATDDVLRTLDDATLRLDGNQINSLKDILTKLEKLQDAKNKMLLEQATLDATVQVKESQVEPLKSSLVLGQQCLLELENAFKNEENAEFVALRGELEKEQANIRKLDSERIALATEVGRIQATIDKYALERSQRESHLSKMVAFELVTSAFSRKGIPSVITRSQLPMINDEISRILNGIVDFTIELEGDDESDSSEVYINYGDSRRIIELCSGMEKMVASVAIRVALINVSSLPKTDMFVIDEGFGALDESGVEACNRLLQSLKRYFRTVVVITHVEGVKDAADTVIEVMKNEKDAKVIHV